MTDQEMDAIVQAITDLTALTSLMAKEVARLRADVEDLKEGRSDEAEEKS